MPKQRPAIPFKSSSFRVSIFFPLFPKLCKASIASLSSPLPSLLHTPLFPSFCSSFHIPPYTKCPPALRWRRLPPPLLPSSPASSCTPDSPSLVLSAAPSPTVLSLLSMCKSESCRRLSICRFVAFDRALFRPSVRLDCCSISTTFQKPVADVLFFRPAASRPESSLTPSPTTVV